MKKSINTIEKIVASLICLGFLVISCLIIAQIFNPETINLGDPYYKSLLANERMPYTLYFTWAIVVLVVIELIILIIKKIHAKKDS